MLPFPPPAACRQVARILVARAGALWGAGWAVADAVALGLAAGLLPVGPPSAAAAAAAAPADAFFPPGGGGGAPLLGGRLGVGSAGAFDPLLLQSFRSAY